MKCAASGIDLQVTKDHSVRMIFRCRSADEAAVLFGDLSEAVNRGAVSFTFEIDKREPTKTSA